MKMVNKISIILLIAVLSSCSTTRTATQNNKPPKSVNWELYQGTEQKLRDYFDNSEEKLDPIEGIFTLSHKIYNSYGSLIEQKDNWATLAIIRDKNSFTREFKEINLDPGDFPKYAITAEFTKASNGLIYVSKQFSPDGSTANENFVWDSDLGMLTSEKTEYYQGNKFTIKRYYLKTYPKSVNIVDSKIKGKSTGSCFAISKDGLFITNHHVIENNGKISILLKGDLEAKSYSANVILKDEVNDIALIKVNDPSFKNFKEIPYRLSESSKMGDGVFTIGYPLSNIMGENLKYTDGSISALSGIADDIRYYQISVPLQPGNSGGPLFNKSGNIIGITTAKLNSSAVGTEVQNVNYAIKAGYIKNIINMLPSKPDIISSDVLKNDSLEQDLIESLGKYIGIITSEN